MILIFSFFFFYYCNIIACHSVFQTSYGSAQHLFTTTTTFLSFDQPPVVLLQHLHSFLWYQLQLWYSFQLMSPNLNECGQKCLISCLYTFGQVWFAKFWAQPITSILGKSQMMKTILCIQLLGNSWGRPPSHSNTAVPPRECPEMGLHNLLWKTFTCLHETHQSPLG